MPSIACDADSLIASATCDQCKIPPGMQGAIQIYLLDQIRVANGGAEMTTDELVEAAKCIQHCIPPGMQGAIEIYLLCSIAAQ